ncbi:MAG TPA: cytochrome c biogenesis protein CcsA [Acidimicrobiales bacterium]|nr:cytochrome c biogenesis protein CcsA [Acidimicrobiales bacterium]
MAEDSGSFFGDLLRNWSSFVRIDTGDILLTTSEISGVSSGRRSGDWWLHAVGITGVIGVALTVWLGLWVTPPDKFMGNLVRLVYIHPPVAWVAFLAFGITALCSALYLWKRTRDLRWDRLAGASGEVGVVFIGLTLVCGSIWGRPTWGVWWTWDPLLTTTAILFLLYLGYLTLRKTTSDPNLRAKRSAVAALISVLDVPIVHFSVLWWRSLHQAPTVLNPTLSPEIHGQMAWTLLLGFVSFTLVFVWMTTWRYRLAALEDLYETAWVELAIQERRNEVLV